MSKKGGRHMWFNFSRKGCMSKFDDFDQHDALKKNGKIERQLQHDEKTIERTTKILLLGAGESGKSTIIKQMRIIHSGGFPPEERHRHRAIIYSNLIIAFRVLLEIMRTRGIEFENEKNESLAELIWKTNCDVNSEEAFSDLRIQHAMNELWIDKGMQEAVARGHEFALNDNFEYFFGSLNRLFMPGWLPNNQDMLHSRLRTTGITETLFEVRGLRVKMIDVGGQRSERRKWIHSFEGVHSLLFIVALSGYNQSLLEDQDANQMHEALGIFDSLIHSEWFKSKPIILFLNKMDLFKAKLPVSPVRQYFPDYSGSNTDVKAASKYFAEKFCSVNRNPERDIYPHYTSATDTHVLDATMRKVQSIILEKNFRNLMLL